MNKPNIKKQNLEALMQELVLRYTYSEGKSKEERIKEFRKLQHQYKELYGRYYQIQIY